MGEQSSLVSGSWSQDLRTSRAVGRLLKKKTTKLPISIPASDRPF